MPKIGIEPTTNRLQFGCSTVELHGQLAPRIAGTTRAALVTPRLRGTSRSAKHRLVIVAVVGNLDLAHCPDADSQRYPVPQEPSRTVHQHSAYRRSLTPPLWWRWRESNPRPTCVAVTSYSHSRKRLRSLPAAQSVLLQALDPGILRWASALVRDLAERSVGEAELAEQLTNAVGSLCARPSFSQNRL